VVGDGCFAAGETPVTARAIMHKCLLDLFVEGSFKRCSCNICVLFRQLLCHICF